VYLPFMNALPTQPAAVAVFAPVSAPMTVSNASRVSGDAGNKSRPGRS
jgi:hypothetical protein